MSKVNPNVLCPCRVLVTLVLIASVSVCQAERQPRAVPPGAAQEDSVEDQPSTFTSAMRFLTKPSDTKMPYDNLTSKKGASFGPSYSTIRGEEGENILEYSQDVLGDGYERPESDTILNDSPGSLTALGYDMAASLVWDAGWRCPPPIPEGYLSWHKNKRVVKVTLPHMVPTLCMQPICSASTTVHRSVTLQEGDTLQVLLKAPADYRPPSVLGVRPTQSSEVFKDASNSTSPHAEALVDNRTHIFSREDHHIVPTRVRRGAWLSITERLGFGALQDAEDDLLAEEGQQERKRRKRGASRRRHGPLTHIFSRSDHHPRSRRDLAETADPSEPSETSEPSNLTDPEVAEDEPEYEESEEIYTPSDDDVPHLTTSQVTPEALQTMTEEAVSETTQEQQSTASSKRSTKVRSNKTTMTTQAWQEHQIAMSAASSTTPTTTTESTTTTKRSTTTTTTIPETETTTLLPQATPLTIWKVSRAEWAACGTREGGQVAESDREGVVEIAAKDIQKGDNYFIGRSSWSGNECFKLHVAMKEAKCGEDSLCSGKGVCYTNSTIKHYQCQCCDGYTKSFCQERNACWPNPCMNAGICLDITEGKEGTLYQCLCPHGFRGTNCEIEANLCDSSPCLNGGVCVGNHTSFTCDCKTGWTGTWCEKSRQCLSGPCVHGVCVETKDMGYRCFCEPGYGGNHCEFEYDECDSNPCGNGGTCLDLIGTYKCQCGDGFTGQQCHTKINLCEPNPCSQNRVCVDKGNKFACECLHGFVEDNCGPHTQMCNPNPCQNGGTCWNENEMQQFFCSCRPGFTGETCQGTTGWPYDAKTDERKIEAVDAVGTIEPHLTHEVRTPLSSQLNHTKNIFVAFATLACALLIVIIVVGACHCRVNRTYRKCLVNLPRTCAKLQSIRRRRPTLFIEKTRREKQGPLRMESDPDGVTVPMTASSNGASSHDSVFYNMDMCDNQEPLIN